MIAPWFRRSSAKSVRVLLAATSILALSGCKPSGTGDAPERADTAASPHGDHGMEGHEMHHHHGDPLPPTELPGSSIFHLSHEYTTTTGDVITLASFRGQPSVFVMFYGSCTTACPMLFSNARQLEAALPEDVRGQVRFVFVTFDPERDTQEALAAYAQNLDLDTTRWSLLRSSAIATRALATVLGVQYRPDGQGGFNHTNRLSVIDRDGAIIDTIDGLDQPNGRAVQRLTELVRNEN